MPRYSKIAAKDLINFAKKLTIRGNYFDKSNTSAFEFARQMGSPALRKANPSFLFEFNVERTRESPPPSLRAEFINGQVWETETESMQCSELRNEVCFVAQNLSGSL